MKKYLVPVVSMMLCVATVITYNFIGSEVTPEGFLIEPFYLIPLSYIFLFVAFISGMLAVFKDRE